MRFNYVIVRDLHELKGRREVHGSGEDRRGRECLVGLARFSSRKT
jgi:hypothetical protein